MKKLVISLKNSTEALDGLRKAYGRLKRGRGKGHFEISFDSKRDFNRFLRSIDVLSCISTRKPTSLYQLAKMTGMDPSNLNKVVLFLEELGALRLRARKVNGREVRTPLVEFDTIELPLAA